MNEESSQPSDEKKILFMIHGANFGGAELSLLDLLRRLPRDRYSPHLLSLSEGPIIKETQLIGIPVSLIPATENIIQTRRETIFAPSRLPVVIPKIFSSFHLSKEIAEFLRQGNFDMLYTNSLKAHAVGAPAAKAVRIPLVWHMRDILFRPAERLFFRALQLIYKPTVITNSRATAACLSKSKMHIVYNGIDMTEVIPTRTPQDIREELGIPLDATVVGMAGRIQRWKGHEVFLNTARMILSDFADVYFVIAGSALYSAEDFLEGLKAAVSSDEKLKDRVIFAGFRKDIMNVINIFDIFVHPSIQPEPFGRSIMETMALGKPVVATRTGGPEEIVKDDLSGLLVEPNDPKALALAVGRLLIDNHTARFFGENGRKFVETGFTMDNYIKGVRKVLDGILFE
ncbi:MAG: glycosyltransferase family 4 protein [bacterium]